MRALEESEGGGSLPETAAAPARAGALCDRLPLASPAIIVTIYLVAYLALDWLSFIHALHGVGITPWNPSPGLSLALLLTQGLRYAPALALAALLSSFLLPAVEVPPGAAFAAALVIGVGYAGAAAALRRILRIDPALSRARDVIALLAAALIAAALVAPGFVAVYALAGILPWSGFIEPTFQYWIGDAIGIAVVAPPLLLLLTGRSARSGLPASKPLAPNWRFVEGAVQMLGIVAALVAVFGVGGRGGEPFKYFYLLFLPLIWIAARRGLVGAAWAVFAIQGGLIAALEFLEQSAETVRAFQLLMFSVALTGLLLGAVVSERRRAVRALAASESRLATILDTAPDGVITIDERGRIESANPAVGRTFGSEPDRLIGRRIEELVRLPESASIVADFAGAGGHELVARRADGSRFPVELTVGRLEIDGERRYTLFMRDVAARQEAQARAREHQAELAHVSRLSLAGEMASALAHELNQPLTAIIAYARGCARLLQDPEADRTVALEAFNEVVQQAERAGAIIARLREFLRQGVSHCSTLSVTELVNEALGLAGVEAVQNGVEIEVRLPPDLPDVLADRVQIEQVIINLVRNAIEAIVEAASPRRAIRIDARPVPHERVVEIDVADSGPGVSEAVAAHLFEPFVTTKRHGMGLGLSISRSIVEAQGGRLRLVGRPGQAGAVFAFTLPMSQSDEGESDAAPR